MDPLKSLLILFFCSTVLFGQVKIDEKIKKTTHKLHSYSKNYSTLNKKMSQTAEAILKQKKEIVKQDAYLEKLQKDLKSKEEIYKKSTKDLIALQQKQKKLKSRQQALEEDLVFVIAKSVSLSVMLSEDFPANQDSMIELEVLKAMLNESKAKEKKLSQNFFKNATIINSLNQQTEALQKAISAIDAKRKELIVKKEENKKSLKKLKLAKASYKKELQKLLQRQNSLKKTLAKLNLIKIDAIKKAKEEKARQEAFKRHNIALNENLPKVKKHGSSYQSLKTIRYRGPKTIAPLKSYTITKKYGTYVDPIYGIKIFNESISLKPKRENAKVRTVFNGKVIYADRTAVLNNIVIVEHKHGLHTIYANLSKIAPNIHPGQKVRRGAVIGRVKHELIFEVTQKSAHINPIRLFK